MKRLRIRFERDVDGWWVASVPSIKGCHTQGRSIRQARERICEALALFVDDVDAFELEEDVRLPSTVGRVLARTQAARRKAHDEAERAQTSTAEAARLLTQDLHLSVRDAGELLGLSHQRVQQLLEASPKQASRRRRRA